MKIGREKRIRSEYVKAKLDQIVQQIVKSVGVVEESINKTGRKSPKNICQETGRARGIVKDYRISRHIYRRRADAGAREGVRRGTW